MRRVHRLPIALVLSLALVLPAVAQQQTAVSKQQARPAADWIRSGIVYEIYPRQFSEAGTFKGVETRLDDLDKLGVNILWLMPIHPIGEVKKKGTIGSPYAVRDYYGINPAYGTAADLKSLVRAAHQRRMKVIIDMVLNHTAWDNTLTKQHPEWYKKDAQGNITYPYDWSDVAGLDYRQPGLRVYMTEMMKYWIREFDLDGFRCDVAGEVPTDFWENARVELEKVKPDIFMLAETNKPELLVKAFEADYGWPLFHAMSKVLNEGAPATLITEVWQTEKLKFPRNALELHMYDNHDEKRGISRFGERGVLAAAGFVLTTDGIPLIYNGNEAGDSTESGAPALFEKMPIFWKFVERRPEFPKFFTHMIALRKSRPALQQGETQWLKNSAMDSVLTYVRRAGNDEILVTINFSNRPFRGTVQAQPGAYTELTPVLDEKAPKPAAFSPASLELTAWGVRIFSRSK